MSELELCKPQVERFTLGCMMIDPGVYNDVRRIVKAEDFSHPAHRLIFAAICDLAEGGKTPDAYFVSDWLRDRGKLDEVGPEYVAQLPLDLPTSLHAEHYAAEVRDLAVRRRLSQELQRAFKEIHDETKDPAETRQKALAALEAVRCDRPGEAPLKLLTGADVLTTEWPEPVWAIPGLLPVGLTILAGKPKRGKSWLALQIAHAVTTGGYVLGQRVEQGPVLYLALEDSYKRMCARMQQQQWSIDAGALMEIMPLGQFTRQIDDLQNGGGERLAAQIERREYRLTIIDTLSRSCYGDQNDAERMTRALTPVQEMAHDKNCAILMVDHHKKGFGADPDAVGDILGSTAKGAMADTCWGLYRDLGKSGAKLAVVGRDIEERNLALSWDFDTGSWQVEGDADQIALTERRQEILDALAELGRCSAGTVAKAIEADRSNTYKRLQDMANAGLVVKVIEGRRIYYETSP